ncbi:hypothetical protein [Clostridium sp. Marseille-P2415]|uniref:hypothetical protein n=1 Tax=Clostridium sp. Marseille-P2415 TaxID=1805471 RepID=UPI0009884769|nr:hypothetical protein [Clostridium sp. Marseille-P2415]
MNQNLYYKHRIEVLLKLNILLLLAVFLFVLLKARFFFSFSSQLVFAGIFFTFIFMLILKVKEFSHIFKLNESCRISNLKSAYYLILETKNLKKIGNILFFTALGIFFIQSTLSISMLNLTGDWWKLTLLLKKVCILMAFLKIALDIVEEKYNLKTLFVITFISTFQCVLYLKTENLTMVTLWVFILAAKEIEFDQIIKYSFYVNVYLMLFVVASSLFGVVENRIYLRFNGDYRYSLGYQYTTNIANLYMHMIIMYVYWKKKKISIVSMIVLMLINVVIYRLTDTRNAFGIGCIVLIGAFVLKISSYFSKPHRWINYIYIWSIPFFAFITVCMTSLYNQNISWMNSMNIFFNDRLNQGKLGIEQYGIDLFGNKIEWVGGGIIYEINQKAYNYVDSSYVQFLLEFGLIAFLLACIYFMKLNDRAIKKKDVWFGMSVFLIASHSILDPQLMWLEFNPFLLYGLSKAWDGEYYKDNALKAAVDKKNGILINFLLVGILILTIFYGSELSGMIRTWMNMYQFYAADRQKYFVLFFIIMSGIVICIGLNIGKKKIRNRILVGGCVLLMGVGYCSIIFMIAQKQKDYEKDIQAGIHLIEELENQGNQFDAIYVEDIPYCYRKLLKGVPVIAGTMPKQNENAIVFAKKGNYYKTLFNNNYFGSLLYDKEYVFVKNEKLKQGIMQQGVDLKQYYDGIETVDLKNLAKMNDLPMILLKNGQTAMEVTGEEKSLVHGPYLTVYKGKLKVTYELTLLETNIDTGEVAKARISSDYGKNIIALRDINKGEFNENAQLTISMIQDVSDSANMEFLLFANGNSKIAISAVKYQIVSD